MKRLLLDTHIWLWYLGASPNLSSSLREALDSSLGLIWLSPISVWEASVLAQKGRIRLPLAFEEWFEESMHQWVLREAAINFEIARSAHALDLPHGDPADRLLAATAMVYDLHLVTLDRHLVKAPWLPTLTA